MYKKDLKVMDCTVRDGGLMNNWQFSDEFVKAVYDACVEAGVDYMEIGYKSSEKSFSRDECGAWKFCREDDLRRIVGDNNTNLKLSALADIGRIEFDDIVPKSESVLDMIRVACYAHQVDKAIYLAEHCMDKGYEVTINLMAVSKVMEHDLDIALDDIAKSRVPVLYLVDSFGSMYCEQIEDLMKKYIEALPGKTIGIHAHNNMQLAFSNTITSIINGCTILDATLLGMGRGAGNCPLELLIAFLKNPKYRLLPILDVIQNHVKPLQQNIDWGYHIPYMISGSLNDHPRNAMKWMDSDQKDNFTGFLKKMHDDLALLE
jgi:4-hydroxy 2-oxovalerate aldolase